MADVASGPSSITLVSGSSSRDVLHEWLDTLRKENRTNNSNNAPSPKTTIASNNENCYKPSRACTLLLSYLHRQSKR